MQKKEKWRQKHKGLFLGIIVLLLLLISVILIIPVGAHYLFAMIPVSILGIFLETICLECIDNDNIFLLMVGFVIILLVLIAVKTIKRFYEKINEKKQPSLLIFFAMQYLLANSIATLSVFLIMLKFMQEDGQIFFISFITVPLISILFPIYGYIYDKKRFEQKKK